ncbi:hypothetical protein EST38_g5925 [Candolleomyces aberdarensis]|uniref:Uncharacterized protein n=1 Tax=Candolleomyces aberdarensis TaxID=2316362 RepID=A0A4Q2DJ87_9AGAR|nr:hypothetical protein EST38_g5925 [Candolleomyces aberdarensis]
MSSDLVPPARQRTTSFSEVSTSDKARALVYLLNSIDATTFVQRLLDATKPENGFTSEEIEGLTDALERVGFERSLAQAERAVADDTLRHCVRCHHSYLERENKNDACVIRHSYPFSMASASSSKDAHQQCLTCQKLVPTSSVVDQICVATRHTTNTANLSSIRNSKLIRTCEEVGCNKTVALKRDGARPKLPVPFTFSSAPMKPVATPPKGPESWTLVPSSSFSSNASVGSEPTEDSDPPLKRRSTKQIIRHGETSPSDPNAQSPNSEAKSTDTKTASSSQATSTATGAAETPTTITSPPSSSSSSSKFTFAFAPLATASPKPAAATQSTSSSSANSNGSAKASNSAKRSSGKAGAAS